MILRFKHDLTMIYLNSPSQVKFLPEKTVKPSYKILKILKIGLSLKHNNSPVPKHSVSQTILTCLPGELLLDPVWKMVTHTFFDNLVHARHDAIQSNVEKYALSPSS